jgi:DNA-directed RNA polymerase subunit L
MEVKVINMEKDFCEVSVDNITIAEIVRVYLNNQGIKFAAWRKEHPTRPVTFRVESSGKTVKKAISDAISEIKQELNKMSSEIKKT